MQREYYTVKDIAGELKVSEKSVRKMISSGKIKGKKVLNKWVVTANNLKEFMDPKNNESGVL